MTSDAHPMPPEGAPRPASPLPLAYGGPAAIVARPRSAARAIASVWIGVAALALTFALAAAYALHLSIPCMLLLTAGVTPAVGLVFGVQGVDPCHDRPRLAWLGILLNAAALLLLPFMLYMAVLREI